ncbi:hypothetical protein Tco_0172885 [Tanacetum coccineum]
MHSYDNISRRLKSASTKVAPDVNHLRIPCESLDEGLITLMGDEDVLTLFKYVPKFREIKVYMEESMSLVEEHWTNVMNGKGKGVVIEEILEDDVLDEQHKREERMSRERVNIEFEFENEGDKMKKKVSQDSVIIEEVIEDMNSNLEKIVENLKHSQDNLEMPGGMEGDFVRPLFISVLFVEDGIRIDMELLMFCFYVLHILVIFFSSSEKRLVELLTNLPTWMEDSDGNISDTKGEEFDLQRFFEYDDVSISGLSNDFPTLVLDDDVSINGQAYEDVVEYVTDPLMYEDVGDEDV